MIARRSAARRRSARPHTARPGWRGRILAGLLLLAAGADPGLLAFPGLVGLLVPRPSLAQDPVPARPPTAPVRPVVDTLYGVRVSDPYRYMENLKDTAVDRWFREENAYTRAILDRIPGRAALLADIRKYDRSQPATVTDVSRLPGDLYFYEKTLPGRQVARLYMRHGLHGTERLIFDPTTYEKASGPQWTISYYSPSFDGRLVAVGVARGGGHNAVLRVVNTRTRRETGEAIPRARVRGTSWSPDGRWFFYTRFRLLSRGAPPSAALQKARVYVHVVGAGAKNDRPVFGYAASPNVQVEASDLPFAYTIPGSTYVFGALHHGIAPDITLYAAPLDSVGGLETPWRKIVDVEDAVTSFAVHGDDIYLLSHRGAPRFQVLRTSLRHPNLAGAQVVVPPGRAVIERIVAARDALYVQEHDGVTTQLLRVSYGGGGRNVVAMPYHGTAAIESANLSQRRPKAPGLHPAVDGMLFRIESWTRAPKIYAYDPATKKATDTGLQPSSPYDSGEGLASVEVSAHSYDGTMVPLSILYPRGTKLDGSHPAELFGYGAYGSTFYPFYAPRFRAWLDQGAVIAFCHVRGGGMYGESWHRAGQKLTKPNTWRDFLACAEYLVGHKYTSPPRLGILGASAGGITVDRAITERPELFAAIVDQSGLSNPLRFEVTPNGPANIPEFGSIRTQAGFEDLYAIDAYQHIRDGVRYPGVLLTVGWNDPFVAPWQAGKMAARLQAATASGRPVLLRVDYSAGHADWGTTRAQREALAADAWSFELWQFGVPGFQPAR